MRFLYFLLFLLFLTGCEEKQPELTLIPITSTSEEAKIYYSEGKFLSERGKGGEAFGYYQKALELDPNFALANFEAANTHPTANGFFEYLERAMKLVGDISEGERLFIRGYNKGYAGDLAGMWEDHKQLLAKYPEDPKSWITVGIHALYWEPNYEQAEFYFKKALSLDPKAPYLDSLGEAQINLGKFAEAVENYKVFAEQNPENASVWATYGNAVLKAGNFPEAEEIFIKAISFDHMESTARVGLSWTLMRTGRHSDARENLEAFLAELVSEPEKRKAFFHLANVSVDEGLYNRALHYLFEQLEVDVLLEDSFQIANTYELIGFVYLDIGKFEKAWEFFKKSNCLIQNSDLSVGLKSKQETRFVLNAHRIEWLIQPLEMPEKVQKDNFESPFSKGLSFFLGGENKRALESLQKVERQTPETLFLLGQVHLALNQLSEAKEALKKAANFNAYSFYNDFVYARFRKKALKLLHKISK